MYFLINYIALNKDTKLQTEPEFKKIITEREQTDTVEYDVVEIARGLSVPWSIVFTPSYNSIRMLVTERTGTIRIIDDYKLIEAPLFNFSDVYTAGEAGLMGMDIDPNYSENKLFYVCVAVTQENGQKIQVVKMKDNGDNANIVDTIIDNIPAAQYHDGCRIKFGPDQKLYITTGDAANKAYAQDLTSLAGKILRINTDGTFPADNPFENSPIYSYGHRNPQGLAWTADGKLISTEHGPSVFDGPAGGDEVNIIETGANYGWPVVSHENSAEGMVSPQQVYTPAVAPASALVYSGRVFTQFTGDVLFGGLRGEGIYRAVFSEDGNTLVGTEKLTDINVGRVRDIVEEPYYGEIYFSTSNTDGRGEVRDGDDKIYHVRVKMVLFD